MDKKDAFPRSAPTRYFVMSVAKAFRILEGFARDGGPLALKDLAERSGENKATVRRIALTLVDLGYLEVDRHRRFSLAPKILDLGSTFLKSASLPEVAEPLLADLAERLHESVNLAIRDGRDVLYLVRVAAAQRILALNLHVGSRLPLHATSLGKALLLDASREEVAAILGPAPWPSYTDATCTDADELLADLDDTRRLGCAVGNGELELGLRSIAVPIRDAAGVIVAAINVSTHTLRIPLDRLLGPIREELMQTGAAIERALGRSGGVRAGGGEPPRA